jgi:hypothetical protein
VHAHSDHGKAREILGAEPRVGLDEGLARMARWVEKAGVRKSPPFAGIEVERGLPGVWRED